MPVVLFAERELARGAEHSVRCGATDLSLLELETARQRRPCRGERILRAHLYVRRATHDVEQLALARVDLRHPEMIGVRMRCRLDDLPDDDAREIRAQTHELIHRTAAGGDEIAQLLRRVVERNDRLEPLVRCVHWANCSRKAMSESY